MQKLVKRVENDTNGYFLHTMTPQIMKVVTDVWPAMQVAAMHLELEVDERLHVGGDELVGDEHRNRYSEHH